MVREKLKQYAIYPPPWFDNHGSCCLDPSYGISDSFIKDKITFKTPFSEFHKKFLTLEIAERNSGKITGSMRASLQAIWGYDLFAPSLSFISQDGLIFYLFGVPEGDQTIIWQIYFDDNTKYPPNIKDARKETTAFKNWLIKQIEK